MKEASRRLAAFGAGAFFPKFIKISSSDVARNGILDVRWRARCVPRAGTIIP